MSVVGPTSCLPPGSVAPKDVPDWGRSKHRARVGRPQQTDLHKLEQKGTLAVPVAVVDAPVTVSLRITPGPHRGGASRPTLSTR